MCSEPKCAAEEVGRTQGEEGRDVMLVVCMRVIHTSLSHPQTGSAEVNEK
jgi:hypothetical protein